MKPSAKAYFSFTRMERLGILCLSGIIVVLMAVRATMVYWVHPAVDAGQEQKLQAAWQVFKRSQPTANTAPAGTDREEYADHNGDNTTPLPALININTADSATIVRLKGIGPAMAHKIMAYRKAHAFKTVDELLDVQHIPDATFAILKKHLITDTSIRSK